MHGVGAKGKCSLNNPSPRNAKALENTNIRPRPCCVAGMSHQTVGGASLGDLDHLGGLQALFASHDFKFDFLTFR